MSAAASDARAGGGLPPLVAAVVNWNGRDVLPECLSSLLSCGYPDLAVMVIDNDSRDGSAAEARARFPAVEVIDAGANLRWAGGNNLALRRLRAEGVGGRHLLLLNNDTVIPPGSLAALMEAVVADGGAWLATPRICYAHAPGLVWYDGGRVGRRSGWVRHAGIRRPAAGRPVRPHDVDYGTGCALLLCPRVLERTEELDEGYHFYGEDTDFCLRLRAAGGRILHVPRAVILHKVSAALGAASPGKLYLRTRSHVRLLRRHWPPGRRPVLVAGQLAFLAATAAWYLWRGHAGAALAAWRGACDELLGAPVRADS